MVPPFPWKLDALARLAAGLLLCLLIGTTLAGMARYDADAASVSAPAFLALALAGVVVLAWALMLVLREWTIEGFGRRAAVVCVLVFAGLNLSLLSARFGGGMAGEVPGMTPVVISTLALQGAALALVAWFLRQHGLRWRHAFGLRRAAGWMLLKGVLLGVLAMPALWVLQALCREALSSLGWEPAPQTMIRVFLESAGRAGQIYLGFVAVVMAPIAEELLFRGILYPALKQRFRRPLALAVTSLIFAALHANAATFVPLTAFAVALGLLYDRTRNLLAPIAAHAVFNAGNVVLLIHYQRQLALAP